MSNILTFPKTAKRSGYIRAEATPDGVSILTSTSGDDYEHTTLIAYEDAVNRLDNGTYDDHPDTGYAIHRAIADGGVHGWFDYTTQHNVMMWRWLIATVFLAEMKRENGTTAVAGLDGTTSQVAIYSNGKVAMPVYPCTERMAMANNIEGAMIERYGTEVGAENAVIFYRAMLDEHAGTLTKFGRETLAEMHDFFISDLEENGWPETPVAH